MKLKSLIMFSAAALAFAACSNDEDVNGGIKGDATVKVNVQDAVTRAIQTPTNGNNGKETIDVDIQKILLTLNAASGMQTINVKEDDGVYEFQNVRGPQSITVSINGGVKEGQMVMTSDIVNSNLAEPLYAESNEFTQNGNDYTVTLTPNHRLARLQFSGIQHVDDGDCIYKSLTFDGLYLNGVRISEANQETLDANTVEAAYTWNTASAWELPYYDWAGDNAGVVIVGEGAVNTPLPATNCYAYNFIPGTNLPILTLCFSNAYQKNTVVNDNHYRYASVKNYVFSLAEGESLENLGLEGIELEDRGDAGSVYVIKQFMPGYIYNITGLQYDDDDLTPDPTGESGTLTATVVVKKWSLVNGTVEWN